MFHVPVGVEDEAFSGLTFGNAGKHVARNGIQPHQPVGARKPNQRVVRSVDQRDPFSKAPLFPERVTVVESNRLTDGPRKREQRGGHVLALAPEEIDEHNSRHPRNCQGGKAKETQEEDF